MVANVLEIIMPNWDQCTSVASVSHVSSDHVCDCINKTVVKRVSNVSK